MRPAGLLLLIVLLAGWGAPHASARTCHDTAYTTRQALPPIEVVDVRGMDCRQGAAVMRRVAPAVVIAVVIAAVTVTIDANEARRDVSRDPRTVGVAPHLLPATIVVVLAACVA